MAVEILRDAQYEALELCDRAIEVFESEPQTALSLFKQAFEKFPTSPKINSWLGYAYGVIENKVALGLKHCKMATDTGEPEPIFFRNIGKLYIIQKNKKAAIGAFAKGLQIDKTNEEILKEWKVLGFRRKPFFQFLSRENILNKWMGKITWKLQQKSKK